MKIQHLKSLLNLISTVIICTGLAFIPYYMAMFFNMRDPTLFMTWLLGFMITLVCLMIIIVSSMLFVGAYFLNRWLLKKVTTTEALEGESNIGMIIKTRGQEREMKV